MAIQGVSITANVGNKSVEKKSTESIKQEDKKTNKATTYFISAAALSAAVIGGLIAHKNITANNAIKKEITNLERTIGTSLSNMKHYSTEPLYAHLKEICKLNGKEKLAALKDFESTISRAQSYHDAKNFGRNPLLKGLKETEELKAAYESKDALKTVELYKAHMATLPNSFRPINRGATVTETIENTFGKNSYIKPHTYDLSKENQMLAVQGNAGGFKAGFITKEGVSYYGCWDNIDKDLCSSMNTGFSKVHAKHKNFKLSSASMSNRKVVQLDFLPEHGESGAAGGYGRRICVISPNNKLTPLQRDLLKLAEHPENFDLTAIRRITRITESLEKVGEQIDNGTYFESCDYDLLLSAIQSMANKS